MWDILLTWRLTELGQEVMYCAAVDDAHEYDEFATPKSNPGRAEVIVKTEQLKPEFILRTIEAGDLYSSTGVTFAICGSTENGWKSVSNRSVACVTVRNSSARAQTTTVTANLCWARTTDR